MRIKTFISSMVGIAAAVSVAGSAIADTISINLNSFADGSAVQGGASTQTAGGGQWWLPDNSSTSGFFRSGLGRTAGTTLAVGNRGNGMDGVIHNIFTPRLANAAGSAVGGNTYTQFNAEYWVRTVASSTSSTFRFRSEVWGGLAAGGEDRTTFFAMQAATDGSLRAYTTGANSAKTGTEAAEVATGLNWGSWYRVTTSINFLDGALNSGTFATYTTSIFDEVGLQLGQTVQQTWGTMYASSQPQVDRVSFHSRYGTVGDNAYVDGISYSSVPAPGALALLGAAGLFGARRRRA